MNKKYIIASMALLAILGACDDDYNDQFDIDSTITDVKSITYTLTSSDYGSIASNETNQELALSKDPETGSYVTALNELGSNRYFTEMIAAEDYIPAFLAAKYPNADSGSKFVITYNQYQEPSDYLSDFSSISTYTLTSGDYETVWGSNIKASYLSPSTLSDIPSLLASNVSGAAEGDVVVVNYAYSDLEPSSGGSSSADPTWTEVGFLNRSAGTNWNFVNVGPVSLADYAGQTVNIGFKYTSTSSSAATWEIKNFKVMDNVYQDVYVYALQDDGTYKQATSFSGAGSYVFVAMGADGQYYPFGRLSSDTSSYGYMYPDAITVTDGVITAEDAANFVITVEATDAGYTLKNAIDKYIYMSGSYNSFNVADAVGESGYDWTISSATSTGLFNITNVEKAKTVKLNYYNGNYSYGSYPASTVEGHVLYENTLLGDDTFTVYDIDIASLSYVWTNTTNYGWKASAYANSTNYATESYLVSPAIEISESASLPHFTVDEAFRYGSAENLTVFVSTDFSSSSAASASAKALRAAASTRAASTNNAAGVYVYDGSSWSEYTSDDATITAVDETVYTALNASYIASPETVLPIYLSDKYPYAAAEDKVGVVYYASASALDIAEYTFDGTAWAETSTSVEETITFTQDDSGISANMSTYLSEDFTGSNAGGFTIQDISLSGLTYVWTTTASYGWKASAYMNSTNNPSESWIVSPAINFAKATAPVLSFSHVQRYVTGENSDFLSVLISTNYSGDVSSATWDTLTIPTWGSGSDWTFVDSGEIDLSSYVGSTVYVAFRYISTSAAAPTWEIESILIEEASSEESAE